MATANVLVQQTVRQADTPKDLSVNQLHFQSANTTVSDSDWQALTDQLLSLYKTDLWPGRGYIIKAYDRADAMPRPPKAMSTFTPTTWESTTLGPREIAICLSFYTTQPNLKRMRGRLYMGPWGNAQTVETVSSGMRGSVLTFGQHLFNMATTAGPAAWVHGIWSVAGSAFHPAQHYWVNDVWDVIRGRNPKETVRSKWP